VSEREPLKSGFLAAGAHRVWWELHRPGAGDSAEASGDAGPREVVCLLNGLAMHTRAWYPFLEDLAGYDVLLYDYLGQGQSSSPDEAVTIPQLAGHLRSILDELGIERCHLMGVSYGGFVALDFARLFHPRLHTLTLSGILLSRERTFELYQAMSLRFYAGGRRLFPLYTHYLYEKIFGERFLAATHPEELEAMRRRFEERYAHRIHSLVRLTEAQNPFFAGLDGRLDEYRAVPTPTLILAGEQDRAIPLWAQAKLARVFPNSRFELLPEAGHVVYLERRDLFFPRLRRFLASRDPGDPPAG
jgi:3-oxoadipate enol-lactonase